MVSPVLVWKMLLRYAFYPRYQKKPTQSTQALSELQCKQRTRGETAKDPPLRLITTTTVPRRRQLCRRNRRHLNRRHHPDHGDRWRPASCDGAVRDAWCSSSLPLRCCSTICCWPSLVSTFLFNNLYIAHLNAAVYWTLENVFTTMSSSGILFHYLIIIHKTFAYSKFPAIHFRHAGSECNKLHRATKCATMTIFLFMSLFIRNSHAEHALYLPLTLYHYW